MSGNRSGGAGAVVNEYITKTRQFSRNANLYVLHVIGMDMIHGSWTVLFNLYLLAIGFDIKFIALRLIIEAIARAITAVPAGLVSDRIGRKASFVLGDGIGAVIGLVQGGVQALSRSYYSRLIPLNQAAEFYGFYNMLGKFAAILGPVLMGLSGLVARSLLMPADPTEAMLTQVGQESARWSIASIILLFLIGGYLFWQVDETQGRKEIRKLQDV